MHHCLSLSLMLWVDLQKGTQCVGMRTSVLDILWGVRLNHGCLGLLSELFRFGPCGDRTAPSEPFYFKPESIWNHEREAKSSNQEVYIFGNSS